MFIDYLMFKYLEEVHPLDDMIADGFPEWYDLQDIEEISEHADEWKKEGIKEWVDLADKTIKELHAIKKLIE